MTATDTPPIRQSTLHNRLVIDLDTTEEVGRLDQFLVDVKTHQIEGFVCRQGLFAQRAPVLWVQVESIGQDSILVRRQGSVITERLDDAVILSRQEIWTDAGDNVGQLVDYCIDLQTGAVTQYLFTAPGWQGLTEGVYTFQPASVVSAGKKRMMVRQAALANAPQFTGGVQERVSQVWQQDVDRTRQDLQGVLDNTQAVAEQVQQTTQKLTEQARSQFGQVFGKVKQQSKQWRSQVNDRFADAAASMQARSESLTDSSARKTIDVESEAVEVWPDDDRPLDSEPQDSEPRNSEP